MSEVREGGDEVQAFPIGFQVMGLAVGYFRAGVAMKEMTG